MVINAVASTGKVCHALSDRDNPDTSTRIIVGVWSGGPNRLKLKKTELKRDLGVGWDIS